MELKIDNHIFEGLHQDAGISKQEAKYLSDAFNVRLTARNGNSNNLVITNERGTTEFPFSFTGTFLGYSVLNNNLVVFTHDEGLGENPDSGPDYIYLYNGGDQPSILYQGNLNFQLDHPIETLADYETENILKVYWTDGYNQPRFINIAKSRVFDKDGNDITYDDDSFDFVLNLQLKEVITVTRTTSTTGEFDAGVIQYAFTYYNLNGLQTNVFYTSPLQYTSFKDRGGSPEDKCSVSFRIDIKGELDKRFDYIRIYSIHRTSLNATPYVKRIADLDIKNSTLDVTKYKFDLIPFNEVVSDFPFYRILNSNYDREVTLYTVAARYRNLIPTKNRVSDIQFMPSEGELFLSMNNIPRITDIETMLYGKFKYAIQYLKKEAENTYDNIISTKDDGALIVRKRASVENSWIIKFKLGSVDYYIPANTLPESDEDYFIVISDNYLSIPNKRVIGETKLTTFCGGFILVIDNLITISYHAHGGGTMLAIATTEEGRQIPEKIIFKANSEKEILDNLYYIDTGLYGDAVDPQQLFYMGGEDILAGTIAQKDGTMFLGNISINKNFIQNKDSIKDEVQKPASSGLLISSTRKVNLIKSSEYPYLYYNSLSENTAGFKRGEYYRLGVLFLHITGKWSEPVWLEDKLETEIPDLTDGTLTIPTFEFRGNATILQYLKSIRNDNYLKVRPIVVFPSLADRVIKAQGFILPTLYTEKQRDTDKSLYAQASWFFRYYGKSANINNRLYTIPEGRHNLPIPYIDDETVNPLTNDLRMVEILGNYNDSEKFKVDWNFITFHTPEVTFDESIWGIDWSSLSMRCVGYLTIENTMCESDIIASSTTISTTGSGFVHKSAVVENFYGLYGGLYWDDFIVEDYDANGTVKYRPTAKEKYAVKWLVYPWHRQGSLNNDSSRVDSEGVRSSELETKVLSNMHYFNTEFFPQNTLYPNVDPQDAQLFSTELIEIIKVNGSIYQGNIDTALVPDAYTGNYFAADMRLTSDNKWDGGGSEVEQNARILFRTYVHFDSNNNPGNGNILKYINNDWVTVDSKTTGDKDNSLNVHKSPVRMKYRTTPHVALKLEPGGDNNAINSFFSSNLLTNVRIPIVELYTNMTEEQRKSVMFGGRTEDALRQNFWFPAGEPESLDDIIEDGENMLIGGTFDIVKFSYGDTWFLRYDCLKTYPYTVEDPNQIVEIGSAMFETHINIDGRYDKNRGQRNNTMMNPTNFNRLNPVYSQPNNFFNYLLLSDLFYSNLNFKNQITWSTVKQAGAEVDNWSDITLAAVYNIDGDKGEIEKILLWKDKLLCFLHRGLSEILFNSRVQVETSDGVPIEIANNYKVDGIRYIAEQTGTRNKFSVCSTDLGVYFIDTLTKNLHVFNGEGITDLPLLLGMTKWFTTLNQERWSPINKQGIRIFHDSYNSDVYVLSDIYTLETKNSLCFSEKLSQFTSYHPYGSAVAMFNMNNHFYCYNDHKLYSMFTGEYNNIFNSLYPFYIEFVSNLDYTIDKTFTNIDLRGNLWEGAKIVNNLSTAYVFDTIRALHEYQDSGIVQLDTTKVTPSNMKKKFGIWRINIPRDKDNKFDRIRNTWTKLFLGTMNESNINNNQNVEIHDISVMYYV